MVLLKDVKPLPSWRRHESEKYFQDPATGRKSLFPSLDDVPSLTLSVIVPAFNEQDRCEFTTTLDDFHNQI